MPMDTGETYCFQGKEARQEVKLLTIACRFVPYDQWLVTHVDSSWSINEVKSWILAKCIANSSSHSSSSLTPDLPLIHPPAKPKKKLPRRPASPIVFAEFPPSGVPVQGSGSNLEVKADKVKRKKRRSRGRPISPITFAPIGVVDPRDDSEDDVTKLKDEFGEVIGMGYEEDDEWDSQEDESDIDELELELDPNPRMGRRANRNQYLGFYDRPSVDQQSVLPPSAATRIPPSKTLVNSTSLPRGSYSTYHPNFLNLIRFSTGQILEKHYTILDYEIQPYELLEVHRLGVVIKLPREITFKYIEPYWEGWVKALRIVFREPRVVNETHRVPNRRKDTSVEEMSKTVLDGGYKIKSSPHTETARKTMEVLAGGPVKVAPFSPADVALGLRPARGKSAKKSKRSAGNDLDLHTSVLKSTKLNNSSHHDAMSQSRGAIASTSNSGPSQNIYTNKYRPKSKGGKLEWRERWVFIKDGVLHLQKENSDSSSTTTQILPLDSLTEIRNADQLGRTALPSPSMYIVCARFKMQMATTKPVSESPESPYSRRASQSNVTSSHTEMSSALKSPVNTPKPSSLSRGGSMSHSKGDSNYSIRTGHRNGNVGPSRPTTSTSSISKPKIMLKIKPLPPPAPTRVVSITQPSSSTKIAFKDKGKGKMPADPFYSSRLPSALDRSFPSDPEVFSRPPSETTSEVLTEEEGAASDDEADAADRAEGKKRQRMVAVPQVSDRKHPQISIESDADSDGSGDTLSSPVFAHTENDSPFSDGPARSYGYGHGHIGGTSEWRRKEGGIGVKKKQYGSVYEEENEENVDVDTSYVVVSGNDDNVEDPGSSHATTATRLLPSKHSDNNGEKREPESEWVVLDLGDDFAFKSFLRVIHRHAPHLIDSSFLSNLPPFQMPKLATDPIPAAPAPTPTFTSSFPSPEQVTSPSPFDQWSWNNMRQEPSQRPVTDVISPITPANELNPMGPSFEAPLEVSSNPSSVNNTPAGTQTPVLPIINAPRDSRQFQLPPSPHLFNVRPAPTLDAQHSSIHTTPVFNTTIGRRQSENKQLNIMSSQQKKSLGTFGALPYPEWRLEVVTKAQRAGMGELTKAMDQFLWGDNPGLTLLTRELGLSLAPMELIRSPSIQTAVGDRSSVNDEGDSTGDAASMRRQQKRKDRKLTLEQENIAIGLNFPGDGNMSSKTLIDSDRHIPQRFMESLSVSGPKTAGSRPSLKLGYVDIESSESGEESSDAEWLGWMADLHRQARLQREQDIRLDSLETESAASSTDTNHYWDYQQQDDHRRYQEERRALEPTGVVTSSYLIPTSPIVTNTAQEQGKSQHYASSTSTYSENTINRGFGSTTSVETYAIRRPASPFDDIAIVGGRSGLTSPSSNESLSRVRERRSSFGLSPSDPPSSATSPSLSQVGHGIEISHHEHQHLGSRSDKHRRQISGMVRDGPNLSHYASTGLIGTTSVLEQNSSLSSARRPSMPVLSSSSYTPQPESPLISGSKNTRTTIGSQQSSEYPVSVNIPRRSSITGSGSSVSLGRSSSMLSKTPGLLRKKGPEIGRARRTIEKEKEYREREIHANEGKQKEKLWKGKGKERDTDQVLQDHIPDGKSRRQRLSLSLSSSQAYNPVSTSKVLSPPPSSPTPKSHVHHTTSRQQILSNDDAVQIPTVKKEKKRGVVREKAERLLQNLESTLDFVDL
ncbi:hypothetical protein J3R30DRAFT_1084140 [Lentinula aciculospora]|uniref:PH domain-containing protein n=1 Tax=Lentinula aciculospora TaxID=153920 RepID=A0A9W9A0C3_9AGAR|nr:hypothetical protein J3R30DRAFT_1084140 [Lentinula aciculospora]